MPAWQQIVYIDDSGADGKSRVAAAAFCVSTAERWQGLLEKWNKIAEHVGFELKDFHTTGENTGTDGTYPVAQRPMNRSPAPHVQAFARTQRLFPHFLSPHFLSKHFSQMPSLTLKPHAQPGICLYHKHQQQISWANPALPLSKPLSTLRLTSLATKTEQPRSHRQRRHRHRKRIAHFRPNPCLEPSTLDRTGLSSALRSTV